MAGYKLNSIKDPTHRGLTGDVLSKFTWGCAKFTVLVQEHLRVCVVRHLTTRSRTFPYEWSCHHARFRTNGRTITRDIALDK